MLATSTSKEYSPAELTSISATLVHGAALVGQAHVLGVLLHGAFEKALAPLARPHSVVLAGGVVAADGAHQRGLLLLRLSARRLVRGHDATSVRERRRRRRRAERHPARLGEIGRGAPEEESDSQEEEGRKRELGDEAK